MSSHHARVPVPGTAAPAPGAPQTAAPAAPEALRPAAATLTVGAADDRAEHAADALADRALARLDGTDPHRHTPGCGHLRRSVDAGATGVVGLAGGALDADVTSRVDAARSGGTGLPGGVRRRMESAFGTDLGHVRVHTGPEAGQLSRAMSAEAFTTGDDIFFGSGRFAPHDPVGEKVLAHEIAHVVQETGSHAVRRLPKMPKMPKFLGRLFGGSSEPAAPSPAAPSQEDLDAQKTKEGKVAEQAEIVALAEARASGEQGRATLAKTVAHAPDAEPGSAPPAPGTAGTPTQSMDEANEAMHELWVEFDVALAYELKIYQQLIDVPGTDPDEAAQEAFDATWHDKFVGLESVMPNRGTAAERLMRQVRSARKVEDAHAEEMIAEDKELEASRILPKDLENLYDRMVTTMRSYAKTSPDLHPALARDKAAKEVRSSLAPKVAGRLPVRHSEVDREAWARAEGRAPIVAARRERQSQGLLANLTKLDEYDATAEKVEGRAGGAVSTVGSLGGTIADQLTPEGKQAPGGSSLAVPEAVDGGALDAVSRAAWREKNGVKSDDAYEELGDDPLKTAGGKAKEGISTVTDMLGGLLTAVREAFATARSVRDAWKHKDPHGALKATKSGASAVDALVASAKSTANLSKLIDPGVASGVAKVVPGLDIAAAALSMVKAVTDVAVAGMRQHETDTAMFQARVARKGEKANVMVWPLMNVSRRHTKTLESVTWALGSSVADLGLSIGQVVTAGGFGIPAAIKGVKGVVDSVHSLGHFIADEVYVAQAKTAEQESGLHLEGGAENELRKHPKAAVDGIVLRAAAGDKTAENFLANYRVNGRPIGRPLLDRIKPRPVVAHDPRQQRAVKTDPGPEEQTTDDGALAMIREAVLESMGTAADPQNVFERTSAAFSDAAASGSGLLDRWRRSGTLADDRNGVKAGGEANGGKARDDRGFMWRMREALKGEEHLARKERMTGVLKAQGTGAPVAGLVVGAHTLAPDATPPKFTEFLDKVSTQDLEAELAKRPSRNSPEMVDLMLELLQRKLTEAAA
ncbi:eCIS core domain-containing protein [Cellulomonas dongxiuzhuiae]|uniref:DUF4157 domain-containing protein n=1 Tax=Cellulomonas dongxiuzhuiae TaxID=2819979 RepID=A0ABX8GIT4_9CELL|nr:DUF4157 domain-containing protein [Cellulomonas dongxiuzhuiae]MBO3088040.1 DUF4157 domain-containing protein [Cellulomonas dongxiuzhuiae]MBO3094608.1 DUF4157 domain-containing protein [Cellulomonas dongxiuzhuiae]QWC15622.1 DUF4157 domain-containing protein [Cellulomonas dongxiuzhuiae]